MQARSLSIYTIYLCLQHPAWPSPNLLHTTQNLCWTQNYRFSKGILHGIILILYKQTRVWFLSHHLRRRDCIAPTLQRGNWGKAVAQIYDASTSNIKSESCHPLWKLRTGKGGDIHLPLGFTSIYYTKWIGEMMVLSSSFARKRV